MPDWSDVLLPAGQCVFKHLKSTMRDFHHAAGHSEEGAADGRQGSGYSQQPQRHAEPWWLQAARGHARPSQMPEPGSEPLYVPQHMQRPYGHRGQHLNGAGSARPAWQHRESETRQPGSYRPPGPYLNGQHRGDCPLFFTNARGR